MPLGEVKYTASNSMDFRNAPRTLLKDLQGLDTARMNKEQLLRERARQDVLDARATTLFEQQQADRERQLKDRENRIMLEGLKAELLPHLQAQDTSYGADMKAVMGQSLDSTLGMTAAPQAVGSVSGRGPMTMIVPTESTQTVNLPRPNPEINFPVNVEGKAEKLPEKSKFRQVVEGILPVSGIGNILKAGAAVLPDPAMTKLLETPGMYKTVPGSSVRELTPEGKAALAKGEIPGKNLTKTMTTNLDSIDFSRGYDTKGKPFTQDSKGDAYFVDKATGKMVNEKSITRAITGVDMKPQKVETVIGTKTVAIPGLTESLTSAVKGGANPQEVQAVGQGIRDRYMGLLDMLPKDNTARREELRGYLTMMASNLGMDPKDYDIGKEVDSILPKTEMSDAQRSAIDMTMKSLDKELDQINKNRDYSLQRMKFEHDAAIDDAQLALSKLTHGLQAQKLKAEIAAEKTALPKAPEGYIWDIKQGKLVPKTLFEGTLKAQLEETGPKARRESVAADDKAYSAYLGTVGNLTRPYTKDAWIKAGRPAISSSYGWLPFQSE